RLTLFGVPLSFHFSILGSLMTIMGASVVELAVFAKVVLVGKGLGESPLGRRLLHAFPLEGFLLVGLTLGLFGTLVDARILLQWVRSSFGTVAPQLTSLVMLASTAIILG